MYRKNLRNIYITHSIYSLLLILIVFTLKETDEFIISKNDLSETILQRLKYRIKIVFEPKIKILRFINYKIFFPLYLKKYLNNNYKIIMSCDHKLLGQYFANKKEYFLIEDGSATYTGTGIKNLFLRKLLGLNKESFGRSNNCIKIYLTGLATIPEEIKDKVEIINLKELWNKKSKVEKEEILSIFGFNNEIINNLKGKNKILYTQPLSEDGVISEEEKIELYRQIIKNYNEEELVIKKHPREKTDYKVTFPKVEVLDQSFPAELFNLLDIKFEKAITIFSTAALSDKEIEIDFYGTEIHPKLKERFGSMENVMKRNVYLDGDLNE